MTAWFLLKLIHVFAGAFWFGAAVLMIYFIAPAVKATAPAGGAVMGHLNGKLKMASMIAMAAWITTLSGVLLIVRLRESFESGYLGTLQGAALAAGAVMGILTFVSAVFVQLPRSKRIAALGAEAGPTPTPEQAAEIQAEQKKFANGGHIVIALFVLALLGMLMSHPI